MRHCGHSAFRRQVRQVCDESAPTTAGSITNCIRLLPEGGAREAPGRWYRKACLDPHQGSRPPAKIVSLATFKPKPGRQVHADRNRRCGQRDRCHVCHICRCPGLDRSPLPRLSAQARGVGIKSEMRKRPFPRRGGLEACASRERRPRAFLSPSRTFLTLFPCGRRRRARRTFCAVIAGLDPAIHEAIPLALTYVRPLLAALHHGCAGQARA